MSRTILTSGPKYDPLTELDIDELVERLTPGEIQTLLDECDPGKSLELVQRVILYLQCQL